MNRQHSSRMNFFVLADSHGRRIDPMYSTSSFDMVTRAIPGLKWNDYRQQNLCVNSLLSTSHIQSCLSQANGILFVVGTNSIRIMSATNIIPQIQHIIHLVQKNYPHLNNPKNIAVALTFSCLKPIERLSNQYYLTSNINQYNHKLKILSSEMNFTTLDLHITEEHLCRDRMHIHPDFNDLIFNGIINHFNELIPPPSIYSISTLPLTSISSSDEESPSQSSMRTRDALDRRKTQRHEKLKKKRKQHMIKIKIHSNWSMIQTKQYLKSLNIKYGCVLPIFNETLRLQFNNKQEQDFAENQLGSDAFNEDRSMEFINNQHS